LPFSPPLSFRQLGDLSLIGESGIAGSGIAGIFISLIGDTSLQVEPLFSARSRLAGFLFLGCALLTAVAGCHRAPAPDVVATVNGKDIQRAELERQYQIVKMSQGQPPQDPSPEQVDLAHLEILSQMINQEILQQRAASLNVIASDEDVQAKITEMKAPFTQEEFDQKLKQSNQTLDDLKREVRHQLTESKLMNKEIESKINITDAEIANFYAAHKSDFNYIETRYYLARILVSASPPPPTGNQPGGKAPTEADAKKKIQFLHQRLENGDDFGTVAMNSSEDQDTAANGGEMGMVLESQLHNGATAEVYDAITKLKPGQFTDVLPFYNGGTAPNHKPVGYAIYKLISKDAPGQRTLDNPRIRQLIRQTLRDGRAALLKNAYLEKLRDDAKVHNYLADQILNEGVK
jgi:peptidyl-prolyl cis-trans isomerase SurA